jgi:hypothetical protein
LFFHVLLLPASALLASNHGHTDGVAMIAGFFMEDAKEKELNQAAHKIVWWFYYMDDTFVIWPHGPEELERFLPKTQNR